MSTTPLVSQLEDHAVQAAKRQDWAQAVALNQQLLADNPDNVQAYIRMGVAQAQLGENDQAKQSFTHALELDKTNHLVKKHLQKLENNQKIVLSTLSSDEQFIEEPGKTKTIELHRLAGKDQLDKLSIGQSCELKTKNRFIAVEVQGVYIGALPEDISSRLSKLMKGGNTYSCYLRSVSSTTCECSVFIKETHRSADQEFIHSFPPNKGQLAAINEMYADDNYTFEMENIPVQIVETDNDEEHATTHSFPVDDGEREHPEDLQEDNNNEPDNEPDNS